MAGYTHPAANTDDPDSNDREIGNDADTLKKHQEITSDPKRHAAAHGKLLEQTQAHQSALDASHKQMRAKVKHGLKQSFPSGIDKPTPFQGDSKGGGTPFDEAKGK